jgi:hypothetical protein
MRLRACAAALLVFALLPWAACHPYIHIAEDLSVASRRDLSKDEAEGGHTLARHVGRTDAELRERLMREHISAASSYTNRATAERTVGAAIAASARRIGAWMTSSAGHPNLVLDYDSPTPIGRTLRRDEAQSTPCSHALVVLKWKPPSDFFVLTSYPECK